MIFRDISHLRLSSYASLFLHLQSQSVHFPCWCNHASKTECRWHISVLKSCCLSPYLTILLLRFKSTSINPITEFEPLLRLRGGFLNYFTSLKKVCISLQFRCMFFLFCLYSMSMQKEYISLPGNHAISLYRLPRSDMWFPCQSLFQSHQLQPKIISKSRKLLSRP